MTERAITPPDFEVMRAAIMEAGRDALNPDAENCRALFERAFEQVRGFRADAIKWKRFFKRNPGARDRAQEVRYRAERRLAQLLDAMQKIGILTYGRPTKGHKIGPVPSTCLTLDMLGIDRHESHQWRKFSKMSDAEFEGWLANPPPKSKARRKRRMRPPGATQGKKRMLGLSAIRVDDRAQPRVALQTERVAEYVDDMRRGDQFPALIVFEDSSGTGARQPDITRRLHAGRVNRKLGVLVKSKITLPALLRSVEGQARRSPPQLPRCPASRYNSH